MKIGVISDIHDNLSHLEQAVDQLNKAEVNTVFFLGDLTLAPTLAAFKKLKAPVKAVFGNRDKDPASILERIEEDSLDIQYPPAQAPKWDLMISGQRLTAFHGHEPQIDEGKIKSGIFDLVFSGHTHIAKLEKIGKTLLVNPGPVCGWKGLDHQPVKPSLALVSLKPTQAKIIKF